MITEIDNCSYNTKHQATAKKLGEHGIKLASMDYVSTSLQYQLNLSITRDTSKHQQNKMHKMNKMLLVQKNLQLYQYRALEEKLSKPTRRLLRLP